jgi:hypothetical protein
MHSPIMTNHCINHHGLITQTPSLICRPRVAQPHPRTGITARVPRGTHGPPRALWQPWPGSPRLPSCRTCATIHQLPPSTLHTCPLKQLAGSRVEVRVVPGHSGPRFCPIPLCIQVHVRGGGRGGGSGTYASVTNGATSAVLTRKFADVFNLRPVHRVHSRRHTRRHLGPHPGTGSHP